MMEEAISRGTCLPIKPRTENLGRESVKMSKSSGKDSIKLQVRVYENFEELPSSYERLFNDAGEQSFFLTRPWFENFARTALDPGAAVRIYGITTSDKSDPSGMFVALASPHGYRAASPRKLSALTFYKCFYAPHLPVSCDGGQALQTLADALAAERPRWDEIEVRPLDVDSESFSLLVHSLRAAGFVVQTFFCFGNWYLPVEGRSFAQYMESVPSIVRNTLRRKRNKLEKSGRSSIRIVTGGEELEAAIQDYSKIFLASWKRPEPHPEFMPGVIRTCAQMGVLRLGLVYVDSEPAAVQVWIIHSKKALIYKLAYDEKFADLSVGTILTATLMEHAIDEAKVDVIDYLAGDDAYKKDWMSHRRERWGILAINPRTPRGAIGIARHVAGHAIKMSISSLRSCLCNRRTGVVAETKNQQEKKH
jgi:Acetyltransferase (GNAT) domain